MKTTTILVTGANGLIGRVVRPHLAMTYDTHGIDLTGPFSERVASLDIADFASLAKHLEEIGPVDVILHLAGQSRPDSGWQAVLESNIIGTRNVYEASRISRVRRVVFASSNHITGAYEGLPPRLLQSGQPEPITVFSPIRPDSDYAVSKAFGEAQARFYWERWGIESVCLRIGSVRPDDDPTTDPRFAATWLSHRDLIDLIEKSILAPVTFGIYYGVSNNRDAFWDIFNARTDLGYNPVDDASEYLRPALEE